MEPPSGWLASRHARERVTIAEVNSRRRKTPVSSRSRRFSDRKFPGARLTRRFDSKLCNDHVRDEQSLFEMNRARRKTKPGQRRQPSEKRECEQLERLLQSKQANSDEDNVSDSTEAFLSNLTASAPRQTLDVGRGWSSVFEAVSW